MRETDCIVNPSSDWKRCCSEIDKGIDANEHTEAVETDGILARVRLTTMHLKKLLPPQIKRFTFLFGPPQIGVVISQNQLSYPAMLLWLNVV